MWSTAGTSSHTVRLRHRRVSACATRRDVLGSAAVAGATAAVQNGQARAASEAPIVGKRLLAPGTQISEVCQAPYVGNCRHECTCVNSIDHVMPLSEQPERLLGVFTVNC